MRSGGGHAFRAITAEILLPPRVPRWHAHESRRSSLWDTVDRVSAGKWVSNRDST
jgi:hypothetical protein